MSEQIISRRELGGYVAPLVSRPWSSSLAELLGWNVRTVQRLGTPRMPLDARRIEIMCECLDGNRLEPMTARAIAEWLRDHLN